LILFRNSSFHAVYLIRKYIYFSKKNKRFRKAICKRKLLYKYSIFLDDSVTIGLGLKLPHPTGIIFGKGTKIGKNCTIYQHVTFGGKNEGDTSRKNSPKIGDGCLIYSGAQVLGAVNLGENSIVGANAVVIHSIEPKSIVAGVPAKKVGNKVVKD
jgi:serine O-acetyltransferase